MSDPFDLDRFVRAQSDTHAIALAEICRGEKRSHWMWYIFPQLAGLGHSAMATRYAIGSLEEAPARTSWLKPLAWLVALLLALSLMAALAWLSGFLKAERRSVPARSRSSRRAIRSVACSAAATTPPAMVASLATRSTASSCLALGTRRHSMPNVMFFRTVIVGYSA